MAGQTPPLSPALHPHLGFLAQSGRALLRPDHSAAHPARCLHLGRRTRNRQSRLPRTPQCTPPALHLNQICRRNPRKGHPRAKRPRTSTCRESTVKSTTLDICPNWYGEFGEDSPPLTCGCTAAAAKQGGVIGANPYYWQSGICPAALHAGVIGADGGQVIVTPDKAPVFPGITRN